MEVSGALTATQAKAVLAEMVASGGDPAAIAAAKGYEAMDTGALEDVVDETIAANPEIWQKLVGGDGKAMGALVGQVMKATQGKADGKTVNQLIQQRRAAG
jgi:aspartyl-tRNA(Asn)/glutamyl-tRNA(Gln) amidotransferase subunit B